MIARIQGTLVAGGLDRIEIMTASGLAYEVLVPLSVLEKLPRVGGDVQQLANWWRGGGQISFLRYNREAYEIMWGLRAHRIPPSIATKRRPRCRFPCPASRGGWTSIQPRLSKRKMG